MAHMLLCKFWKNTTCIIEFKLDQIFWEYMHISMIVDIMLVRALNEPNWVLEN